MNPINLGGERSKVNISIEKYCNNLVNTIWIKPLSVFWTNFAHILLMMRKWTLLLSKVKGEGHNWQIFWNCNKFKHFLVHLSRRLKCVIVILCHPASIVHRLSVIKLFIFLTSPLKPQNGIQRNLTGSNNSTSSTKFVFLGLMGKLNKCITPADSGLSQRFGHQFLITFFSYRMINISIAHTYLYCHKIRFFYTIYSWIFITL